MRWPLAARSCINDVRDGYLRPRVAQMRRGLQCLTCAELIGRLHPRTASLFTPIYRYARAHDGYRSEFFAGRAEYFL